MIPSESGEALRRLRMSLTEAEAELAGSDPQAPLRAMVALALTEEVLRWATLRSAAGAPPEWLAGEWREADARLQALRLRIEFGAAYWSGLVSCTVAAEAYGPEWNTGAAGQEVTYG